MRFDKNEYLNRVLNSYKMTHIQDKMKKYLQKREEIKDALDSNYSSKKVTRAINSGSYAKHTAINLKFDVDISQPFKRDSFSTLEEMADDVYTYFVNDYDDPDFVAYKTRRQRVSVGLTFIIDGEEVEMDVVPGRELLQDDYKETNRLNLHVRPKGLSSASSTQTNIQKHVDFIKGKTDERQIIRLIKGWNITKNSSKRLKSFFIELISIKAFEDNSGTLPYNLWGKLEMTLQFIRDNVESIQLKDPANSNNIVSDTLTDIEKRVLSYDMQVMLERIEQDEENLKVYFPVNDRFDQSDLNESSLGFSILSTKSFG